MRHLLIASALAALLLSACGGYGYVGVGYGWGYYPCDGYYDDCYDYYYALWDPRSVAPLDADGDGRLDLVVGDGRADAVWVVRGKAGGGFEPTPTAVLALSSPSVRVVPVTANGDGAADLLVLDGDAGALTVFEADGDGGFATVATTSTAPTAPRGVLRFAYGALDGDRFDDVVYLTAAGQVRVALGTGTGGFADVGAGDPAAAFLGPDVAARAAGVLVVVAEVDGRPGADLVVVDGERAAVAVLPGRGDGTFGVARTVAFQPAGSVLGVAPVTLNDRGTSDLAVLYGDRFDLTTPSSLAVVRLDDGRSDPAPFPVGGARDLASRDLDGDGRTDLLLVDPLAGAIRAFRADRR